MIPTGASGASRPRPRSDRPHGERIVTGEQAAGPDATAVRVALWRALHVQVDQPPHVPDDEIGLRLAAPDDGWRCRPDMDPQATSRTRASIVARAHFIEDLVAERADQGVIQCVILGAGLDTFVQRRPEIAARLRVFGVDRARPPSLEAPAPGRVGLRCPGVVAARAGGLRGRRVVVGRTGYRRVRSRAVIRVRAR